jgi:CDP-glycerol glycerophosphotransferase (TagB/SpsB family)
MRFLSYEFDEPDDNWYQSNNFVVYPIHYQPEASTAVGSPFYENQIDLIRNIAFSLDSNQYLVVKEHVSNYGYYPHKIYNEIKSLPGVKLIGPSLNIKNILKHCYGVITLTSTVGYEALLLGKPVLVFGDIFYAGHPLCLKVNSIYDISSSFEKLAKVQKESGYDNVAFVLSYKSYTMPGRVIYGADCLNICESSLEYLNGIESSN